MIFFRLFKSAQSISVFVLDDQEAVALIKTGEDEGLVFDQTAIDEILFLTRGHPYFIQLLCQEIYNKYTSRDSNQTITIDGKMVNGVVPAALSSGGSAFVWIWNGLPPAERIVFSAIAEKATPGRVLTDEEIGSILSDAGIRMMVKELNLAPSTLVDWRMLEKIDKGYRFYIELMRKWVKSRYPLRQVKEELEKV